MFDPSSRPDAIFAHSGRVERNLARSTEKELQSARAKEYAFLARWVAPP